MFVEQRIYTLQPGKAAEWFKTYEAKGLAIQAPLQGHMVGYFTTEFGGLNQVIHMWAYKSLEDRLKRRSELFQRPEWNAFLAEVRPFLVNMENKLLLPAPYSATGGTRALKNPVDGSRHPLVEERIYTLVPGGTGPYMQAYEADGLKVQVAALGSMVGWYMTEFGPLNQIIHMWSYASMEDRAKRRAEMQANPAWQAYVGKVRPYLLRQENKLLMPAPYSPVGGARPVKPQTPVF